MSTEMTPRVSQLIETIENGQLGLAEAAKRLAERGHPEMASNFSQLSTQREGFGDQLRVLNGASDEVANTDGTTPGRLHRGWITIADAITGDSPVALLKTVVEGEAHAISEYEHALEADLAAEMRQAIDLQLVSIKTSHKLAVALLTQSQAMKRST